MTDNDHRQAWSDVLRQPALPAELAGERDIVASMRAALPVAAGTGRTRARRGAAIMAVTVASLGVGGLVAAGPGNFSLFGTDPEPSPPPAGTPAAVESVPTLPEAAASAARASVPSSVPVGTNAAPAVLDLTVDDEDGEPQMIGPVLPETARACDAPRSERANQFVRPPCDDEFVPGKPGDENRPDDTGKPGDTGKPDDAGVPADVELPETPTPPATPAAPTPPEPAGDANTPPPPAPAPPVAPTTSIVTPTPPPPPEPGGHGGGQGNGQSGEHGRSAKP